MVTFDQWLFVLKLFAALGCGLIAGTFFAFSTFVMQSLGQQPPSQGIATMQSINIKVINPWFMTVFLGTGATCILLIIFSLLKFYQVNTIYLIIGSIIYLVGTLLVTIVFNVPLNNALAIAKPNSPDSEHLWANYLTQWTRWNHIRMIAALVAAALLTITRC